LWSWQAMHMSPVIPSLHALSPCSVFSPIAFHFAMSHCCDSCVRRRVCPELWCQCMHIHFMLHNTHACFMVHSIDMLDITRVICSCTSATLHEHAVSEVIRINHAHVRVLHTHASKLSEIINAVNTSRFYHRTFFFRATRSLNSCTSNQTSP
jgi:hypothetical protein